MSRHDRVRAFGVAAVPPVDTCPTWLGPRRDADEHVVGLAGEAGE